MLTVGETIEGKIETIAFGGEGILRYRGFVVFVPFTAIGDRIACCITEIKRSFAKGTLVELLSASSSRIQPGCPYFGTCGGCQIQHLNDQAQMKYKLNAVQDAFQRIGHLTLPPMTIIPATAKWAYRRHITLHLRASQEGFQAGYIGIDNHSLVVIQTCPIFNEKNDPIIQQIQELVRQIPSSEGKEGKVTLLKNHREQYILSFLFNQSLDIDTKLFQSALQQSPNLAGILVQTPTLQETFGDPYCEQELDGLTFRFTPQTFIQNHPEQSTNIYRHILTLAMHLPHQQILDLYCGFGITSLLLAKEGYPVTGIEVNASAIQFAEDNAHFNHLKQTRFLQGDVEKLLPRWLKTQQPNLILTNPPRQGMTKAVVQSLLKSGAESLIYVSCMPSTLARDLQLLCEKDYRIQDCQVYDMFPQTAHVETLVYLKRRSKN